LQCDRILTAAYGHELKNYGVKGGLTNYAAAYATGLLAARRALHKLKLDKVYVGKEKVDGQGYLVKEVQGERRPFYVLLDVGLNRTTTGSRVFGALKGAVDGGLEIPHNNKRFAGYDHATGKFDAGTLRKHIFGQHIADYMRHLTTDTEKYNRQFSNYVECNVGPDDIEKMWTSAHAAIRKDPEYKPTKKPEKPVHKHHNKRKLNRKQRANRVTQVLAAQKAAAQQ